VASRSGLVFTLLDRDNQITGSLRGEIAVWWNDGSGQFQKSNHRFPFSRRHGAVMGDLNKDGWPDLIIAEYDSNYQVRRNLGNGLFH